MPQKKSMRLNVKDTQSSSKTVSAWTFKTTQTNQTPLDSFSEERNSKVHPYVHRMLGKDHAAEYVHAVRNFIDETSLREMFDTLEKSSKDHFDPDDPNDTRRKRAEERAGRTGRMEEWDVKQWSRWLEEQCLSEFSGDEQLCKKLVNMFKGGKPEAKSEVFKALDGSRSIPPERVKIAKSRIEDVLNPFTDQKTALDDYRIKLKKCFGNGRLTERRTFDHFHKSFPLSPVPPHVFQEEDSSGKTPEHKDSDYYEPGLYLPHPHKWIPDWGHRKQLAAIYGPQYLNYASMPLPTMPEEAEIRERRQQKQRERAYKRSADRVKERLKKRAETMLEQKVDLLLNEEEVQVSKLSMTAASSVKDEYSGSKVTFIGSRRNQVFDIDTFRSLKGPGDPQLTREFKDMVFDNYVSTIDKNNSLPAWKKIYAMHLIPRAFGGPEGDFLDEIKDAPELITAVQDNLFEAEGSAIIEEDDGVDELGL